MNGFVHGKDMILWVKVAGVYQPVACATNCGFSYTKETISTTTATSGKFRSYEVGKKDWSMSFDGIVTFNLSGKYQFSDFINPNDDTQKDVKMEWMDDGGNLMDVTGKALVTDVSGDGDVGAFAGFKVTLKGCGAFVLSETSGGSGSGGIGSMTIGTTFIIG